MKISRYSLGIILQKKVLNMPRLVPSNYDDYNFKWVGGEVKCYKKELQTYNYTFYKSFSKEGKLFNIDDFVLINETKNLNDVEVCKLRCLYESQNDSPVKAAVVTRYTYCREFPKDFLENHAFDEDYGIIEDNYRIDLVIDLVDVVRKCNVVFDDTLQAIHKDKHTKDLYFLYRFRYTKERKLVPLGGCGRSEFNNSSVLQETTNIEYTPNTEVLLADQKTFAVKTSENIQKIMAGEDYQFAALRNAVKRNLNESFDSPYLSQSDNSCLNYSIVRSGKDENLKIKLKVSNKVLKNPIVAVESIKQKTPPIIDQIYEIRPSVQERESNEIEIVYVASSDDGECNNVRKSHRLQTRKISFEEIPCTERRSTRVKTRISYADFISPTNSPYPTSNFIDTTPRSKRPALKKNSGFTNSKNTRNKVIVNNDDKPSPKKLRRISKYESADDNESDIDRDPEIPKTDLGRKSKNAQTVRSINEMIKNLNLTDTKTTRKKIVDKIKDPADKPSPKKLRRALKYYGESSSDSDENIENLSKRVETPRSSRKVVTKKTPHSSNKVKSCKNEPTGSDDKDSTKTPKSNLTLIRKGLLTPSMHSRKKTIVEANSPLVLARSQLHVSFVPKVLPCREKEHSDIYNFVKGKLLDHCGGCMYISGVPGSGKTATVTSVINTLLQISEHGEIPQFNFVSINGMRLTESRQSYVEILKQLGGKTVPWEQAQTILEEKFTKSKKKVIPTVLLVDELDILCTKRQDVVYNLLDWPTKATAQLIVVTIANTMDLPERLLMNRVTSRLGLTRLTFQAYTYKQLQEIVANRLTGNNSFKSEAVQFVARKVASVSGDARRALDICRKSAEIAEREDPEALVTIAHVNEALNAMITQPKIKAIKHCNRLDQLLLQSVVAEVERTGVEETTFLDVYTMLSSLAALEGFRMVSVTVAVAAISRLSSCRLLLTDQKCNNFNQKIILNISVDDVYYALKKD